MDEVGWSSGGVYRVRRGRWPDACPVYFRPVLSVTCLVFPRVHRAASQGLIANNKHASSRIPWNFARQFVRYGIASHGDAPAACATSTLLPRRHFRGLHSASSRCRTSRIVVRFMHVKKPCRQFGAATQ